MEPNRTSSFPAENKKQGGLRRFDYLNAKRRGQPTAGT